MKKIFAAVAALFAPAAALAGPPHAPVPDGEAALHSYILLDRTGSMQSIWGEALGSVNAYAAGVAEVDPDETKDLKTQITLAVFDAQDGLEFDVLRKSVGPGDWSEVTNTEASPRGMTPLFDAIGRMVSLAEGDAPEKAVIVVMTDGAENASREMTKDQAKAALDRVRARGWEVVFLGAEFADFDDADAVGVSSSKSIAVDKNALFSSMQRLGKKSRDYGQGQADEIIFDEEDREIAKEKEVKDRKGGN
ncbi:MAG: VWA domain-containing protein [Pseudomonadota bacterium]